MSDNTPGWQPDPSGTHDHRYWDGSQWTDNVSDGGVASVDPYVPGADAPDVGDDPTVVDAPAADAGDTTAAWPAASGAPAPPPPYVPPATPSADDGGNGGSKRGLLIGGVVVVVVALVAAFFLLRDDDDSAEVQLADRLQEESDGELDGDQATCVAGYFADAIGDDELADIDFDAEEPPVVFLEALAEIDLAEMTEDCALDPSTFGTGEPEPEPVDDGATDDSTDDGASDEGASYGDDPELDALYDSCEGGDLADCDQLYLDSPFGSDYEEFGSTCGDTAEQQYGSCESTNGGESSDTGGFTDGGALPDNFEEILADTYENSLGIARDKAECLAGKLADVIESGEISEDEAMSEIFGYLSDCDISMEEIGAN